MTGDQAKPPLETAYIGFGQVITVGRHLDGERAAWELVAVRKQHLRGLDRVETPKLAVVAQDSDYDGVPCLQPVRV